MVDPVNITNFNLNRNQLEEHLLFWICAAGKNGRTAARCLDSFLSLTRKWFRMKDMTPPRSPFAMIRKKNQLHTNDSWVSAGMKICGIGCYGMKSKSFLALANSRLNLETCSVEELEAIPGIGPKTARCFLIHSRPDQEYAGLDTHILKFMRAKGFDVPKSTPSGKKYREIEKEFIKLAKQAKKPIAEYDLEIWREYSVK